MGIYVPCTKCPTHVRGQEQASRLTFATQVHLDQPLANVLLKKSVTPGNELIPCSLFFDHSSLPSTIPVPDKVVEFPKPKKKILESRSEKSTKIAGTAKNMGMVWVPLIRKGSHDLGGPGESPDKGMGKQIFEVSPQDVP